MDILRKDEGWKRFGVGKTLTTVSRKNLSTVYEGVLSDKCGWHRDSRRSRPHPGKGKYLAIRTLSSFLPVSPIDHVSLIDHH